MTAFSVNLNKIALLRNSRGANYPDVLQFARRALAAGASGITVHPRPDQRHATYRDVHELAALCAEHAHAEFNVEGNPIPRFLDLVKQVRPAQCTLVPDAANQLTSDHGWDLRDQVKRVADIVAELRACGIRVSLFLDPDPARIELAASTRADRIELYTASYAHAFGTPRHEAELSRFAEAARVAQSLGLGVNAGHDLNLTNLAAFLTIPDILEVSIGHAVITEALDYGFDETIRRYVKIAAQAATRR